MKCGLYFRFSISKGTQKHSDRLVETHFLHCDGNVFIGQMHNKAFVLINNQHIGQQVRTFTVKDLDCMSFVKSTDQVAVRAMNDTI